MVPVFMLLFAMGCGVALVTKVTLVQCGFKLLVGHGFQRQIERGGSHGHLSQQEAIVPGTAGLGTMDARVTTSAGCQKLWHVFAMVIEDLCMVLGPVPVHGRCSTAKTVAQAAMVGQVFLKVRVLHNVIRTIEQEIH